jgi:hypothetical protein
LFCKQADSHNDKWTDEKMICSKLIHGFSGFCCFFSWDNTMSTSLQ